MKPKLLLDCDGVLYHLANIEEPSILKAALNAAEKLNLGENAQEELIKASEEFDNDMMYYPFLKLIDNDVKKANIFNKEIVKITDYSKIPKNEELFAIIKKLQQSFDVTVVTDNSIHHVEKIFMALWNKTITQSKIDVYSIEHARTEHSWLTKSKGGLQLFCLYKEFNPRDCLLIDDNKKNIDAAKEINMRTILVKEDMDICQILSNL